MYSSMTMRCIHLLPIFSSLALATTGQIPLTAAPTPTPIPTTSITTTTNPTLSTSMLPTVSYTTTLHLPDLNLHLSSEQLDDPELENIISSLLPAEMVTLLISATARGVPSPSVVPAEDRSESEDDGGRRMGEGVEVEVEGLLGNGEQVLLVTKTESLKEGSTSLSMRGKGWRGVVAAETRVEIKMGREDL